MSASRTCAYKDDCALFQSINLTRMITRLLAVSSVALALGALTALPVSAASLTSDAMGTAVRVSVSSTGAAVTAQARLTGSTSVPVVTNSTTTTTTTTTGTGVSVILNNTDSAVTSFSGGGSLEVSDPSIVTTNGQLNAYADGIMHADPNILNVNLSDTSVAMTYKVPGRFLGFIPVTIKATATVNQDGTVTVSHPWYDFLTATDDATVGTSVEMQAKIMTSQSSTTPATFSSQMQAELMAELQTAFMTSTK